MEADKALQRAESIIEHNYKITGEVKLLPLALQSVHKAAEGAWLESKEKEKPTFLKELEKIIEAKKQSPVEFQRKKSFIICSEKLKTTSIDEKKIKEFITKTKSYLEKCKKKKTAQKKN